MISLALLFISFQLQPLFAEDSLEDQDLIVEEGEVEEGDQFNEDISENKPELAASKCLDSYQNEIKRLRKKIGFQPITTAAAGVPVTLGSMGIGYFVGKWATHGSLAGRLIGTSWGLFLGVHGTLYYIVGREAILIERLINTAQMRKLLVESYQSIDGPATQKMVKKLNRKTNKVPITPHDVHQWVIHQDQSLGLCKGSKRNPVQRFSQVKNILKGR